MMKPGPSQHPCWSLVVVLQPHNHLHFNDQNSSKTTQDFQGLRGQDSQARHSLYCLPISSALRELRVLSVEKYLTPDRAVARKTRLPPSTTTPIFREYALAHRVPHPLWLQVSVICMSALPPAAYEPADSEIYLSINGPRPRPENCTTGCFALREKVLCSRCLRPAGNGGLGWVVISGLLSFSGFLFLFWVVSFSGLSVLVWFSLLGLATREGLKGGRHPPGFCSVRNIDLVNQSWVLNPVVVSLCRRSHRALPCSALSDADSPLLPCPVTCSSVFSVSPSLPIALPGAPPARGYNLHLTWRRLPDLRDPGCTFR